MRSSVQPGSGQEPNLTWYVVSAPLPGMTVPSWSEAASTRTVTGPDGIADSVENMNVMVRLAPGRSGSEMQRILSGRFSTIGHGQVADQSSFWPSTGKVIIGLAAVASPVLVMVTVVLPVRKPDPPTGP
jgi:hypothetical protein